MRVSDADIRERRANLIQILQNDADISLAELSSVLEVSESTVRRDMNYLKERNILSTSIKNSNGQFTTNFVPEFDNDLMFNTKVEEKEAIAKEAASMLESGDVVYINSSSTALRVIKYITCGFVTVITNNARAVFEPVNPNVKVILTGGEIIQNNSVGNVKFCTTGDYAISTIKNILANVCILGISGISAEKGISSAAIDELTVNREMINSCLGKVIIVADNREIGFNHNYIFSDIENVDYLITDNEAKTIELDKIKKEGVEIIQVNV